MRRVRSRGGVGLFIFFLILFLAAVGAAAYFFLVHPKGKKAFAQFLKQFVKPTPQQTEAGPEDIPEPKPAKTPEPAPEPGPDDQNLQKAQIYLIEARKALAEDNLPLARELIDKTLELTPNDPDALVLEVEIRRAEIIAQSKPSPPGPVEQPAEPTPQELARTQREKARAFLAAGDIATAEQCARKAVDIDPANRESVDLLKAVLLASKEARKPPVPPVDSGKEATRFVEVAGTCENNEDFASAASFYRKALELDPGNKAASAGLNRVSDALKQKNRKALEIENQVKSLREEINRTRAELREKEAQSAAADPEKEALEEKIERLERAVRDSAARVARTVDDKKERAAALLDQAKDFLISGALSTAKEVALKALALDPDNAAISRFLGRIEEQEKELAAAEPAHGEASPPSGEPEPLSEPAPGLPSLPEGPTDQERAAVLLGRARTLYETGSAATARDVALKALSLDPQNEQITDFLKFMEKQQQEASSVPEPPSGPTDAEKARALLSQAQGLLETGALDASRDVALRALELDPQNTQISVLLRRIDEARRSPEAPEVQEATGEEKARALLSQAEGLLETGAASSAREVALKALDFDPANPEITALLRRVEEEMDRRRTPEPEPEPVVSRPEVDTTRQRALELFSAARALRDQDALESALNAARKAMEIDPTNPEIAVFIARLEKEIAERRSAESPPADTARAGTGVQPAETSTADTAKTDGELLGETVAMLGSMDKAFQAGDQQRFLSFLNEDLAAAEQDNLVEFFRIADDAGISRRGRPHLVKKMADGTIKVLWPYELSYSIGGQQIQKEIRAVYLIGADDAGELEVLQVETQPTP